MKKTCLIVAALFLVLASGAGVVEFKLSKPYGVLNFIETATGGHGTSATYKDFITSNVPASDTFFYELCHSYKSIRVDYNYVRDEFPENRRRYRSTFDLICMAAVRCGTLDEFRQATIGILPNSAHQKLFNILKSVEPYYDRLVWKTCHAQALRRIRSLQRYNDKTTAAFGTFRTFYYSDWPDDIPFLVALYPIPGKKGNTTASPHGNTLCVGALTGETDDAMQLGVVLHEMCHVLYDEQQDYIQHRLEGYFSANRSRYAEFAYNFFDEGVATALANGWAYQFISSRYDSGEWYHNAYINGYAHALYPLVNAYINAKAEMDSQFVNRAIDAFEKKFPKAITDYGILLNRVTVYADAETDEERHDLMHAIGSYFQVSNSTFSSPILHPYSIEYLTNGKNTQLIVIDRNYEENMEKLGEMFPEIRQYKGRMPAGSYVMSFADAKNRAVLIMKLDKKEDLTRLLARMQMQQYFDPVNPFLQQQ
jgi:hypothetical protein